MPLRLPEQRMWDRWRPRLEGIGLFVERIENMVGEGTADLNLAGRRDQWIELKVIERPPMRPTSKAFHKDHIRNSQRNWHFARTRSGSVTWILVDIPTQRESLLIPGSATYELEDSTMEGLRHLAVAQGYAAICDRLKKVATGERAE